MMNRTTVFAVLLVSVAGLLLEAQSLDLRIDRLLEQGESFLAQSQPREAIRVATEAQTLSQSAADGSREARALFLNAQALYALNPAGAIEVFRAAAAAAQRVGNTALHGRALVGAGNGLRTANKFIEAIEMFAMAEQSAQQSGDAEIRADALRGIGMVNVEIGDYDRAEGMYRQALEVAKQAGAGTIEALALNNFAILERRRGRLSAARDYLERALAHPALPRDANTRAMLLINLGNIHADAGQLDPSIDAYERALPLAQSDYLRAILLGNIGSTRARQGRHQLAVPLLTDARELLVRAGDYPEKRWEMDLLLAKSHRALAKPDEALANLLGAIAATEQIRTAAVPTDASRASAVAIRREAIVETADLLFELQRPAAALAIAEQYRGRSFLDQISELRSDPRAGLSEAQRSAEARLMARVDALQKQVWAADGSRREYLERQLTDAEHQLELFEVTTQRGPGGYATAFVPTITAERLQSALPEGTTVIEYLLGNQRSFVWVVSRERVVMREIAARGRTEKAVEAYRRALDRPVSALTARTTERDLTASGNALYEILLAPIEGELAAARRIVVVADGVLAYVPVDTLGSRPLLHRIPVSYAVSTTALISPRPRPPTAGIPAGLLAIGDPVYARPSIAPAVADEYRSRGFELTPLPATRGEVNAIAALFRTRAVLLGDRATEQTVKSSELSRYRYVHLAVHGMVDERVPARSGIALSQGGDTGEDGILQFREILRLQLNADLVTLSACSTGLGRVYDGEGVIGLARAFMYAGARNVVASLWNVNDAATAELMRAFYQGLNRGLPQDEALRQARVRLATGARPLWRHPYYWAAFTLIVGAQGPVS